MDGVNTFHLHRYCFNPTSVCLTPIHWSTKFKSSHGSSTKWPNLTNFGCAESKSKFRIYPPGLSFEIQAKSDFELFYPIALPMLTSLNHFTGLEPLLCIGSYLFLVLHVNILDIVSFLTLGWRKQKDFVDWRLCYCSDICLQVTISKCVVFKLLHM